MFLHIARHGQLAFCLVRLACKANPTSKGSFSGKEPSSSPSYNMQPDTELYTELSHVSEHETNPVDAKTPITAPFTGVNPEYPWREAICPYRQFYGQFLACGFGEPKAGWEERFVGRDGSRYGRVQAGCSSTLRKLSKDPDMADALLKAYGNSEIGHALSIRDEAIRKGAVQHLLNMAWECDGKSL